MNSMKPIVVLWDVMLDVFYHGQVAKLNPESSAPLLSVKSAKSIEHKIGGAGNVANNIAALGTKTILIGWVGKDLYGNEIRNLLKRSWIGFVGVKIPHTTTKSRWIDHRVSYQQIFRFDIEDKISLSDKHRMEIINAITDSKCEYLVVSDYEKWMIDKELMELVIKVTKEHGIKVIVDAKPNNLELFKNCFLIKPNFMEFKTMMGIDIANEDKPIEQHGKAFVKEMHSNLLVTRWEKGATYITKAGKCYHLKTEAQQVFDVTGAGDTFIAVLAYGLNQGMDIIDAIKLGNKAAGVVVGKPGTAVITKAELWID